jgi:enoyl-CoA hydratase
MPVRLERQGRGAATIVVDRSAKMNALDSAALAALAEAAGTAAQDPELRVVVLRGAGERAFIGGADIDEMAALNGPDSARRFITGVHRACDALRRLPVPVIARIQGHTLSAGLEIAASCDLRIASRSAMFGMPEVRIGLPSVVEAALLPSLIGWGRARRLLLTGETIDAARAEGWGLVEEVVEDGELDSAVQRVVDNVRAAGPRAVRLQKGLIAAWEEVGIRAAVGQGVACFAQAWESEEPRRMLAAQVAAMQARRSAR